MPPAAMPLTALGMVCHGFVQVPSPDASLPVVFTKYIEAGRTANASAFDVSPFTVTVMPVPLSGVEPLTWNSIICMMWRENRSAGAVAFFHEYTRASTPFTKILDDSWLDPRFFPHTVTMAPSAPAVCPSEMSEFPVFGPLARSEKQRIGAE